ncbi:MAG: osmoprotectant NAGGN system M42 family peptidase [Pseudomonadota bacterium]
MRKLEIDQAYLRFIMTRLIETPSPTGMTQAVTDLVRAELDAMRIPYELTRRGALRANLEGARHSPDRAIVVHLDTLGAMVKELKPNGRLRVVPIGHWSARFAEGARVTLFREDRPLLRGTMLPLKASGHVYNEEIDSQPVEWDNIEVRLDERIHNQHDLIAAGIHVGDHIAIDPNLEFTPAGFVNSRHLDDKAGVAALLAMARAIRKHNVQLPIDCHLLFTISEEVGVGASHILHGDVSELVSIDNGTIAPGQNTNEYGATVVMQDMSGPFDWDLSRRLLRLCVEFGISHSRDVFRYYRSDGAAALEAGNDIRTGLVCFALDSSHGYERSHLDSILAVAELVSLYIQSSPIVLPNLRAIASGQAFQGA